MSKDPKPARTRATKRVWHDKHGRPELHMPDSIAKGLAQPRVVVAPKPKKPNGTS